MFHKYSPKESNPVSSDISRFPKTVEDELHKYPENTGTINTLLNPYELDSFPHTFRYVRIMRAFKVALPSVQNYSTYFSTLQEMYGLS